MRHISIEIDGKTISLELPDAKPGVGSFFIFGVHKSGSTLLNKMIRALCVESGFPTLDFPSAFFRAGVPIDKIENAALVKLYFQYQGYAYLGARTFWCKEMDFDFSIVKKVLLVRDPRDAIISWYFSDKISHDIPRQYKAFQTLRDQLATSQDVNDQVDYLMKRARHLERLCGRYKEIMAQKNIAIYRYEDVIFRKRLWLSDMNRFLGLDVPDETVFRIADIHDEIPEDENSARFIRQVTPGNYQKHFSQKTIDLLNEQLRDFLRTFRYDDIDRFAPEFVTKQPVFGTMSVRKA